MGRLYHEETRPSTGGKLHGTQHEENQALTCHAKKGKNKGRKFHDKKYKGGISVPSLEQKKKKDLSHIQCFKCQKYDHYAR